mmetsp:Transcript_6655/g.10070  ORF Transcript_6655/g.10070 Transcript_6655/m.10070 type:complete len:90 (+) Transcript_6655:144-413(+)|eukprot:CAMPEP_0118698372 /NCGR_PEP_ID=MMETSP0800-20121206/15157_1 /TAXON_ID=210618 ORGANISM="Striatella unipunctata, Strain CCMP2910" /NCGR_SAMPLE_ID=MMETSP0800 /ASSEMBLY_ACC=CAM_ASM_000638 /LENGTH=89 /DNA_ID=CAMNT_0006598171 /DNA_START=119 /DNA_END=388 /DNA_ORIENTATION=-
MKSFVAFILALFIASATAFAPTTRPAFTTQLNSQKKPAISREEDIRLTIEVLRQANIEQGLGDFEGGDDSPATPPPAPKEKEEKPKKEE